MSAPATGPDRAAAWVYEGIWAVLTGWFRVPRGAPSLPAASDAAHADTRSFRPSPQFLRYLKFFFYVLLLPLDVPFIALWIASGVAWPPLAFILAPVFLFLIFVPDIIAYVAIHLRYDTTWYVMTDRSVRIRRGIWIITETTITFENVQNITVSQGPLQRHFGIADVMIQTAGGGGGHGKEQGGAMLHVGVIQGVENAAQIRDLIADRVRASRSAGLGDDREHRPAAVGRAWSPAHVEALRAVRDEAAALRETVQGARGVN